MDISTKILIAVIVLSILVYALYQFLIKDKGLTPEPTQTEERVGGIVQSGLDRDDNTPDARNKDDDKILTNKEKGDMFEVYIIERLGKIPGNEFIDRNSDYHSERVSATANREPDLKFKFKETAYAVECKYRSSFKNLIWAREYQIQNYKNYQNSTQQKVLVALGIDGTPDEPKYVYFIPLYELNQGKLFYDDIKNHIVFDFIPLKDLLEMEAEEVRLGNSE